MARLFPRYVVALAILASSAAFAPSVFATDVDYFTATVKALEAAMQTSKLPPPTNNEISGICEITARGDVALKAPCNGVEILLKQGGVEMGRERADGNGEFHFSGLPPGTYELGVASPKFKIARPVQKLRTGQSYLISLK